MVGSVMEKSIFEVGDKVFDLRFGWGIVLQTNFNDYPVKVKFEQQETPQFYTFDGRYYKTHKHKALSFTEYNPETGGLSQIIPEGFLCSEIACTLRKTNSDTLIAYIELRLNIDHPGAVRYYEMEPLKSQAIGAVVSGQAFKKGENKFRF